MYPPSNPILSPIITNKGKAQILAVTLGVIKYRIGFVDNVNRASICSVTLIVAISAAIAEPTLPDTINPHITGDSSLVIDIDTIAAIEASLLNRVKLV